MTLELSFFLGILAMVKVAVGMNYGPWMQGMKVEEMLVAEEAMEETPAESTDGEAATGEEVVAAEGEVVPEGTEAE